jgi:predicted RNA binding protein with dsRBD fold (UPF0201 family)
LSHQWGAPSRIEVHISARVYVTEEVESVKASIGNFFVLDSLTYAEPAEFEDFGVLRGEGRGAASLARLREAIRVQRTLDAARSYMLKGLGPGVIEFMMNKQAAHAGWAVLCSNDDESPLGAIYVRTHTDNEQHLLDWIATPTLEGVPLDMLDKGYVKRKAVRRRDESKTSDPF